MLAIGEPAHADDALLHALTRLRDAHYARDDAEIFRWTLKVAAQSKDPYHRARVGDLYWHGQYGVPIDPEQAVMWYRSAAGLGSPFGMGGLARAHFLGRGAQRDVGVAAHWLAMAADRGMLRANFEVAAHDLSGNATSADAARAAVRIARGLEGYAVAARRWRHKPLAMANPIGVAYLEAGDAFACPMAAPRNWPIAFAFWLRAGLDGYAPGWDRMKRSALSALAFRNPCFSW